MATSPWLTPAEVLAEPTWFWWERRVSPEADAIRSGAVGAAPQGVSTGFTITPDAAARAAMDPPNYARSAVVFAAHTAGGVVPAESTRVADWALAEVHPSSSTGSVTWPDPVVPPGARIEWEDEPGYWVGPVQYEVIWGVSAGNSGGVGSNSASLCRAPGSNVVEDTARTDASLWTPLASQTAAAPTAVGSLPTPVRGPDPLNGAFTYRTDTYESSDLGVTFGLRFPEVVAQPSPIVHPLTGIVVPGYFNDEPTDWDLYGAAAQIISITLTRRFQPPRYRYITGGGAWRLRQRQSLAGADSWPLRQRQNGGATGSWPLRQRQRGV